MEKAETAESGETFSKSFLEWFESKDSLRSCTVGYGAACYEYTVEYSGETQPGQSS